MKHLILFLIISNIMYAQCSDAGVCSVGDNSGKNDTGNAKVGINYFFGSSGKADDVTFNSALISGEMQVFEATSVYASIPYSFQNGPLGEISGIGDLLVLIKQQVYQYNEFGVGIQAGAKIATGEDNQSNLPQIYQSGLGSNDFLAGILLNYNSFNIGAAYQLAGKRNSNILRLERGDDLLLRAGYSFPLEEDFSAVVEVLSIKRLQKSTILSSTGDSFVEVPESNTTQVNVTGQFIYELNEITELTLFGALPLINRPVNIDGLKRIVTLAAGVNLRI